MSSSPSRTSPSAAISPFTKTPDQLARHLARIEGQVRSLQRMVDEDRACIDVLTQITATQAALDTVALALLDAHVRRTLPTGEGEQVASDVLDAVARLLRAG